MSSPPSQRSSIQLPDIVRTVLIQADNRRRAGTISPEIYDGQLRRIVAEELEPKRLSLVVRELADGRTRYLIKESVSGRLCDMVEAPPLGAAA